MKNSYVKTKTQSNDINLSQKTVQNKARALQDNRPASILQRKANNTGLPDNLKSGIENLSGHSMDDVKVHYNSNKPAQLNAHAYAQGTDIHIASGQEKHLPHEAWHVVQQKQGRVKPTLQMKGKVNVNDDNDLEKEADVMGHKALQMKSKEYENRLIKNTTPIVQLKKKKGNNQHDKEIKNWDNQTTQNEKIGRKQKKADKTGEGQLALVPNGSKEFKAVKTKIEQNVKTKPYKTDAFHETQPLMKGIMAANGFFGKLWAGKRALLGGGGGNSFTIEVQQVFRIINPTVRETAFQNVKIAGLHMPRELYAGHGSTVTDLVVQGGYRPEMGAHDSQKGYGALGRGSYFSDQAAKAATYGGLDSQKGGVLIVSDVIEGNQKIVTDGSNERHRTHNSMVKREPLVGNEQIAVPNGHQNENNVDESQYDSIMGQKTYESGSGSYGAVYYRNNFDSNEILIRNADQILPKYKVHYKVIFQ